MSATMTRPMVPAKLSNIFSQYSPAPVQKIRPTKKHTTQTTPKTANQTVKIKMRDIVTSEFFSRTSVNRNYAHP